MVACRFLFVQLLPMVSNMITSSPKQAHSHAPANSFPTSHSGEAIARITAVDRDQYIVRSAERSAR